MKSSSDYRSAIYDKSVPQRDDVESGDVKKSDISRPTADTKVYPSELRKEFEANISMTSSQSFSPRVPPKKPKPVCYPRSHSTAALHHTGENPSVWQGVPIPVESHKAFLSNLTDSLPYKTGAQPVTIIFQGISYRNGISIRYQVDESGNINYLGFYWAGTSLMRRIAKLKRFGLTYDSLALSCGNKTNEFILEMTNSKDCEAINKYTKDENTIIHEKKSIKESNNRTNQSNLLHNTYEKNSSSLANPSSDFVARGEHQRSKSNDYGDAGLREEDDWSYLYYEKDLDALIASEGRHLVSSKDDNKRTSTSSSSRVGRRTVKREKINRVQIANLTKTNFDKKTSLVVSPADMKKACEGMNYRARAAANDLIEYLNLQKDAIKRSNFLEAQYNREEEKPLPPKQVVPFLEKTIGEIFVFNSEIHIINDFHFSNEVVSLLKYGVFYNFESRNLIETTTIEYFIILLQDKFVDFWNSLFRCASKILYDFFSIENNNGLFESKKVDQYVFPFTLFKQEEIHLLSRNGVNSWEEYTRYMTSTHSIKDAESLAIGYIHSQRFPTLCALLNIWDKLIQSNPIDMLFSWADKRNLNIYKIRYLGKKTLEEVSLLTHLTRERIRQITNELDKCLIESCSSIANDITPADAIVHYYKSLLFYNKGVLHRKAIIKDVESVWEWGKDMSDFVEHVLELCCSCSYLSKQIISNSNHCIECDLLTKHMLRHLKKDKEVSLNKQLSIARKLCSACNRSIPFVGNIKDFLPVFYNHVFKDDVTLNADGALSFSGYSKYTLETLFSQGQILSFDEIERELLKYDPNAKRNTIRSFIQHADLVSVDRGKYILRSSLPKIQKDIYKKIKDDIERRIARNPRGIISIDFVFKRFSKALIQAGIQSAYFLYAALKDLHPKGIRFFRFPFLSSEYNESHFTITDQIVLYVEKKGKLPLSVVRKHFEEIGVNTQTFTNIIVNSPQLIVNDNNELLSIDQLGILDWKMSSFIPFKKQLDSLTGSEAISVKKMFADNKSTCLSLDITGPKMLFNILKYTYPQFSFRWPQIAKSKKDIIPVRTMIIDHIRESGSFCTTEELIDFCNEKHVSERVYLNHQTDPEIFRYLDGAYVHRDTIGYQPEWDTIIGDVARKVLNDSTSPQQSYAHLNDICDREDSLPVLSGDLWWTPTLVGDILESTGLFMVYGKNKSIFSSLGDSNNLKCFGDLCAVLLDADFDGAANLTQFSDYLREKELISAKLLTKSFLQGSDRIVINNQEIYTVK